MPCMPRTVNNGEIMGALNIYFYIAFMFGVMLSGFLLGGTSFYGSYFDEQEGVYTTQLPTVNTLFNVVIDWLSQWQNAVAFGVLVGVGVLFSGGNVSVVVPFAFAVMLVNIFFIPFSNVIDMYPATIQLAFTSFIFISQLVLAIDFIRGT